MHSLQKAMFLMEDEDLHLERISDHKQLTIEKYVASRYYISRLQKENSNSFFVLLKYSSKMSVDTSGGEVRIFSYKFLHMSTLVLAKQQKPRFTRSVQSLDAV